MQKSVPLYVCQSGYRYLPCIKFDTMQSRSVKSTRRSVFVQVNYPRLKRGGLCLNSTATQHTS